MSHTFGRRDFLFYGGAAVAGVTLGETGRRWLARADERVNRARAAVEETFAPSVCRECPAACGISARVVDGVPVKLEGNPNCPIARGRLCAKGQAAIEAYFDPDRLVGPAQRVGRRGDGKWAPISWDEAIARLAARVNHARSHAGTMLALAGAHAGPLDEVWTGFWVKAGARTAATPARSADRLTPRFAALTGATGDPVFDVEHASYVLSFGAPLVEDWLSPLWAQRSYGRFRRGARTRGRLVQVDARRSLTARKADEWLPVAPERQAFLAFGIASVLLRENRTDRERLAALGGNVNDFENDVIARYTPDAVAVATGVPVVTLLRLARDLMSTPQPIVIVDIDASRDLVDAVFALNALIGALDRTGGVLQAPAKSTARAEPASSDVLRELAGRRDRIDLVAFGDAAPLRAVGAPQGIREALDRTDLVVSFSPYLDEAAAASDLLMPIHTALESWHAAVPSECDGTDKLACARPAAPPRLATRDLVALLHAAAGALDGAAGAACPYESSEAVVKAELARVWELRRGTPYADAFATNWTQQLERGGWWVPPASSREAFATMVLDAGGWVDPYFAPGELTDTTQRRGGLTFMPPPSLDAAAREADAQPDWPLRLVTFNAAEVNGAGSPNQPALFELLGQPDGAPWRVWAELSPETASQHGVGHGATVRVASAAGLIEVVALIVERTPPGTIAIPFVPAIAAGGRWARLVSADVRELFARDGTAAATRVRVTPV